MNKLKKKKQKGTKKRGVTIYSERKLLLHPLTMIDAMISK